MIFRGAGCGMDAGWIETSNRNGEGARKAERVEEGISAEAFVWDWCKTRDGSPFLRRVYYLVNAGLVMPFASAICR